MQARIARNVDLQSWMKWIIRLSCVLLSAAYIHQYIRHMIQAQDFRRGYVAAVSAIIIAFVCNCGLWFTTLAVAKNHRMVGVFALIPSFIISPMIADSYLGDGALVIYIVAILSVALLFAKVN